MSRSWTYDIYYVVRYSLPDTVYFKGTAMMLVNKPITRSKFQQLLKCKEDIRRKPNRFAKKSKSIERTEEIRLLEKSNTIEMATMSSLPPQWVDQYEECSAVLVEISALSKSFEGIQRRRFLCLIIEGLTH